MSFDKAIEFLDNYRKDRAKALNNEEPMKWSTDYSDTLGDLFDTTFSTEDENAAVAEEKEKDDPVILKLRALQSKIGFLAGSYRDLRTLFAATSENIARSAIDQTRFEYSRLAFNKAKTKLVQQVLSHQETAGGAGK